MQVLLKHNAATASSTCNTLHLGECSAGMLRAASLATEQRSSCLSAVSAVRDLSCALQVRRCHIRSKQQKTPQPMPYVHVCTHLVNSLSLAGQLAWHGTVLCMVQHSTDHCKGHAGMIAAQTAAADCSCASCPCGQGPPSLMRLALPLQTPGLN